VTFINILQSLKFYIKFVCIDSFRFGSRVQLDRPDIDIWTGYIIGNITSFYMFAVLIIKISFIYIISFFIFSYSFV